MVLITISHYINRNCVVYGCFLDASKAFDLDGHCDTITINKFPPILATKPKLIHFEHTFHQFIVLFTHVLSTLLQRHAWRKSFVISIDERYPYWLYSKDKKVTLGVVIFPAVVNCLLLLAGLGQRGFRISFSHLVETYREERGSICI